MPKKTHTITDVKNYNTDGNMQDVFGYAFLALFADIATLTERPVGGGTYPNKATSLTPIGFEGWDFVRSDNANSSNPTLWLSNPAGAMTSGISINGNTFFGGYGSRAILTSQLVYDDTFDSFIISFNGGSNIVGTSYNDDSMFVLFLAKDKAGGVFGGIGTTHPTAFLNEKRLVTPDANFTTTRSNENLADILYLTNMVNPSGDDYPLMKSMMMSVTIPSGEENNKKSGTFLTVNGKKYANLSCVNPSTRAPLLDPWCPY